jgi:predicted PurR-regulated permease PerM
VERAVPQRRYVLAGLFVLVGLATAALLSRVLSTVFFAITVAYVLYPLRQWLGRRGLMPRLAAGVCTLLALLVAVALVAPIGAVLYWRRGDLFAFFQQLPSTYTLEVGEFAVELDLDAYLLLARNEVGDLALEVARAAPVLALEAFLFVLLVYGLLVWPERLRGALLRPVPPSYHDVVISFHERTKGTLYALYVLQAATALGTFVVAWALFWLLDIPQAFALAALAGLLQFIPVLGPSVLIIGLTVVEALAGNVAEAVLVAVTGLVFVAFAPDAVIRPRLARLTTGMPASLYFVGFVGGVLTVGVVGVIAGPLIVALLAECVDLLSAANHSTQRKLDEG